MSRSSATRKDRARAAAMARRAAQQGYYGYPKACERCGQQIWMVQRAGDAKRWAAIDPEPAPGGTIALDMHGRALERGAGAPGELHRPHLETCSRRPAPRTDRRDLDL